MRQDVAVLSRAHVSQALGRDQVDISLEHCVDVKCNLQFADAQLLSKAGDRADRNLRCDPSTPFADATIVDV